MELERIIKQKGLCANDIKIIQSVDGQIILDDGECIHLNINSIDDLIKVLKEIKEM